MFRETEFSRHAFVRIASCAIFGALLSFCVSTDSIGPGVAHAQGAGDLVVAPTRVVLEGRTRSELLNLVNKGSETATYRITLINMRMSEDGNMTEIAKPDPGQAFADRLVRYSPRQVTLEPGASQAIRLVVRKPKDLPAGEYRSHMMFRAVPNVQSQSIESTGDGAAVTLIPVFGIAIPVIVRHGEVSYSVSVDNATFVPPAREGELPRLRFDLNRSGNRSAFGDLTATLTSDGNEVVLGEIKRLAVYTPNKKRTVEMILRVPDGVKLSGNMLKLTYKTIPDEGSRLMGETAITLP